MNSLLECWIKDANLKLEDKCISKILLEQDNIKTKIYHNSTKDCLICKGYKTRCGDYEAVKEGVK